MGRRGTVRIDGISSADSLRVLYIGGCGRSGSTVLDTVLGNHPAMESVGEACHIATNAWIREDTYCACGRLGRDCEFWKDVLRQWKGRVGPVELGDYVEKARRVESQLRLSLARRRVLGGDQSHLGYLRQTVALLAAIRDVSGREIVVDSSKNAARALALSMVDGVDLRLIHLVRDCRGVLWSGKKRFQKDNRAGISKNDGGKSLTHTMKIWTVANLVTGQLRRRLPREKSIRLRYEDFVARPEVELRRIAELVETDLDSLAAAVADGRPMPVGHTIAGNRMRMSGRIQLRPDVQWAEKLSRREQAACWSLVGWLMKAYGYRWHSSAADGACRQRAA